MEGSDAEMPLQIDITTGWEEILSKWIKELMEE
jgi:hypothetical protein